MKKFNSTFKISRTNVLDQLLLAGIHVCFSIFFLHLIIHGPNYWWSLLCRYYSKIEGEDTPGQKVWLD